MVLSFKPMFKPSILLGTKKHSIRADPHGRWKADRTIHMATGVRTKNYNCFKVDRCISTQKIIIKKMSPQYKYQALLTTFVFIDGKLLSMVNMERLAKNDGFKNVEEFLNFFSG